MILNGPSKINSGNPQNVIPVVDLNRCNANGVCTHVCIQNVFRLRQISAEQFGQLSFMGKVKTIFSDNRKAFVEYPERCLNCGLCVSACPEKAIKLVTLVNGK